ncbi:uncharacterized protein LOC120258030 [Dioscorea cayenensis subsp. rotundata]|uniref:Uncharacterized protein LOC120258030 n=1 Tax=Dioscorea cayennensis subsp. rotundata TaxID=55577 RepID=A0AB40B2K0_DIOCR|nr:uncharacterized protein LOC120258030 [Dioscorea cayenensis subsp. rotundata]
MAEEKHRSRREIPTKYDLDAKWDACLDLTIRRSFHSTLAGAGAALLLFRTPTSRWATVAFGAGVGIGRAYSECSAIFAGSSSNGSSPISAVHSVASQEEGD